MSRIRSLFHLFHIHSHSLTDSLGGGSQSGKSVLFHEGFSLSNVRHHNQGGTFSQISRGWSILTLCRLKSQAYFYGSYCVVVAVKGSAKQPGWKVVSISPEEKVSDNRNFPKVLDHI